MTDVEHFSCAFCPSVYLWRNVSLDLLTTALIKLKNKNHTIISIDAEKVFQKFNTYFEKVGLEGTCLNLIKPVYDKPTAGIIINGEKLKAFLLKSGTR